MIKWFFLVMMSVVFSPNTIAGASDIQIDFEQILYDADVVAIECADSECRSAARSHGRLRVLSKEIGVHPDYGTAWVQARLGSRPAQAVGTTRPAHQRRGRVVSNQVEVEGLQFDPVEEMVFYHDEDFGVVECGRFIYDEDKGRFRRAAARLSGYSSRAREYRGFFEDKLEQNNIREGNMPGVHLASHENGYFRERHFVPTGNCLFSERVVKATMGQFDDRREAFFKVLRFTVYR